MSLRSNTVKVVHGFRFSDDIPGYIVKLYRLHIIVALKFILSLSSFFFSSSTRIARVQIILPVAKVQST